jgi:photosystem II stability/assembly factor-like uncharacterized protein
MRSLKFVLPFALLLCTVLCRAEEAPYGSATISGLGVRNIGSAAMSGRISAIAATREPSGKITLFVGAASGGVWKSDDGGTRFRPVFDEQPAQSIGAIALDPKNSKNVWVGTGESWMRNTVSIGDGIHKSTDGGETWTHAGLENSERIAKIVVSPKNSDTVFVAVPGALWSDSPDRGLYKTTDGGKTWKQVLKGANLSTGCTSIAIDPSNSDVMFATMWDFRRKGWEYRSGGESPTAPSASGLFRSADGGNTWTGITPEANKGFPKKPYGRIAVAIAPSNAKRVYAFVESPESALFVSDDGGVTWDKRDKSQWMVWRAFYFANVIVDPKNPDRVFKPDGALIVSDDGGRSFAVVVVFKGRTVMRTDVWIDPTNTQVVFVGDDGGCGIPTMAAANGGKGTICQCRSSITSASTTTIPTASMAVCRTTARGWANRSTRAALPTRSGKTCTTATVSGCFPIPLIPIVSMPNIKAARSGA